MINRLSDAAPPKDSSRSGAPPHPYVTRRLIAEPVLARGPAERGCQPLNFLGQRQRRTSTLPFFLTNCAALSGPFAMPYIFSAASPPRVSTQKRPDF